MASTQQRLTFEVVAEADQAKKALDQIDKQGKLLEKGIEVPFTLEGASKAAQQLDAAATEARALASALAGTDSPALAGIATDASRSADELEQMAAAARKAEGALRDVGGDGGKPLRDTGDNAEAAAAKLDTTQRAAAGTRNAFANLVGNTAQDLGELGGPLGSVGVALGQVAEFTADAANEGGGLTAALSGAASMAGPLIALAAAGYAVTKVMGDMKKKTEESKAANEAFLSSLVDGAGNLDAWSAALDDAFGAGTTDQVEDFNKVMKDTLKATGDLDKTVVAMGQLGLTADDLGASVGTADANFASFAKNLLLQRGYSEQAAEAMTFVVDNNEKLGDVLRSVGPMVGKFLTPEQAAHANDYASALAQVKDVVEKIDTEKKAKEFLDLQRAIPGMTQAVDDARAATDSEVQAALRVNDVIQDQIVQREENKRAAEEGAQAVQEAGTIVEQVSRQAAEAEKLVGEAADDAKAAQDRWLTGVVSYPAAVDHLTESVFRLTDQTAKQIEAGDEGAASFDGNSKAALDNRDAMRDVYSAAKDVIDVYAKTGATSAEVAQKTTDQANAAYDLAIKNGLSEDAAAKLRDTILTVPTSRTTNMEYQERNYHEMLDHRDTLQQDMEATVYFQGVLDRSVVNAVEEIRRNGGIPGPGMVVPSTAAVAPSAGLQAVGAPIPAPLAPSASSASRAVTATVPVVINVNAGLVADTFQLQRAVIRSARSFQRLAGKRAA